MSVLGACIVLSGPQSHLELTTNAKLLCSLQGHYTIYPAPETESQVIRGRGYIMMQTSFCVTVYNQ